MSNVITLISTNRIERIHYRRALSIIAMLCLFGACSSSSTSTDSGTDTSKTDGSGDGSELYACSTPGEKCDAHDPCAIDPRCGDDYLCRPKSVQDCNDNIACTIDSCSTQPGKCEHTPIAGACVFSVKTATGSRLECFNTGAIHPDNPCLECNPQVSAYAGSPRSGGACNDNNNCTVNDVCNNGQCIGTDYSAECDDELLCTDDLCDGQGGCLGNPVKATFCLIGGTCYPQGSQASDNCSQVCDPSHPSQWTALGSHCEINGSCYKPGDKEPGGCGECQPTQSTSSWTAISGTCRIDDQCLKTGDKHPDGCGECKPSVSTTSWTVFDQYCYIDGKCYANAAKDPTGCGECQSASQKHEWTLVGSGPFANYLECALSQPGWIATLGASSTQTDGLTITTDKQGNSYIGGTFTGSISVGNNTVKSGGFRDVLVAKVNALGQWVWGISGGGPIDDTITAMTVDNAGNVYITGTYQAQAKFGNKAFTADVLSLSELFVAKISPQGKWLWAQTSSQGFQTKSTSIAVDSNGNVYIAGGFTTIASFGTKSLVGGFSSSGFLAKIDSNGNWIDAIDLDKIGVKDMETDSTGNIYLAGSFSGSVSFGNIKLNSKGDDDAFIAKRDGNGNWVWANAAGGSNKDVADSLAFDGKTDITLTGTFEGTSTFGSVTLKSAGSADLFIARLNAQGTWAWASSAGSSKADAAYGVAVDSFGNAFVTGYLEQSISFGTSTVDSKGKYTLFAAKVDVNGDWTWAIGPSSANGDTVGFDIATDVAGNIYVVGRVTGVATLGGLNLSAKGTTDLFVWRGKSS